MNFNKFLILSHLFLIVLLGCSRTESQSFLQENTWYPENKDQNLIHCRINDVFNCEFKDITLYQRKMERPVVMEIEYSFDCGTPTNPLDYEIGVMSATEEKFFTFPRYGNGHGRHRKMLVEGRGPFLFKDSDPDWTQNNPKLDRDCYIALHQTKLVSLTKIGDELLNTKLTEAARNSENYDSIQKIANQIVSMNNLIVKSDLTATRQLMGYLKEMLSYYEDSPLKSDLEEEIASLIALNPILDEASALDMAIADLLNKIKANTSKLVENASNRLANSIIETENILLPFDETQYLSQRVTLSKFKTKIPSESNANFLRWSYAGPIAEMHCANFDEQSDRAHAWADNYLCSIKDIGMQFSLAGPVAGKKCVQVNEPSDVPGTWGDNFLCWADPSVKLSWFFYDPGKREGCVLVNEPSEPIENNWHDNFMCWK